MSYILTVQEVQTDSDVTWCSGVITDHDPENKATSSYIPEAIPR